MPEGLSSHEAERLLLEFGYNELPTSKPKNLLQIAKEVIKEPMFLLLISCGALYLILGDYQESIILLSTIFLIIGITFYQYNKTEKALDALKKLSAPRVLVKRDGKEMRIPGREVVPGDVVLLQEGDRIPADAKVVHTTHFLVDESALTGESVAIEKEPDSPLLNGTLTVRGSAIAQVTHTGTQAQLGKIAAALHSSEEDSTRLQQEMKVLIQRFAFIGIGICLSVVALFYLTRGDGLQAILNGLAAAMAVLPEEFPVVLTVFLALGAWRLSKKNVLTRKPSAIETLGSATVLCSDKTGTITQNKMEVVALYAGNQILAKADFTHHRDTLAPLFQTAFLATSQPSADPMDKAIVAAHTQWPTVIIEPKSLVKEYPLSKPLMAITRVFKEHEGKYRVYSKGAPETIFELCAMPESEKQVHLRAIESLAAKSYRVLGLAKAEWDGKEIPEDRKTFAHRFVGLVALEDPIRPEVPQAIQECAQAGVRVIMITGDYPATAQSIAAQIGLNAAQVISGAELNEMSEKELQRRIPEVQVFARIMPEQKMQIIKALKANGEIVAMTGDGVNDAPALKAAHIGIAMGNKGTDVAREASSLVLLDDNFASIVAAIRLGRKIYDNLQKAISYILAIHIPIIGITMLPAFISSLPLLLMPLHIVFMELIIDPICSVAFESEKEEKDIMLRPPRKPEEKFFGASKIMYSVFQGLMILFAVWAVYFLTLSEGHTEEEVRAIAFSSLILGNVILILSSLSKTRSAVAVVLERNVAAASIISLALVLLLLILGTPLLQEVFSLAYPGLRHFIPTVVAAFGLLFLFEGIKWLRHRKAYFSL
ncbi:cation-translocating P-type ATPase [Cytophagales bacterium LB-30]|uniref:Cation-translocating P-type ATPase n=1 Tax=Shiella aurantiaca TaxID=3058365 RepID=A0ABT8F2H4_9BACT|nr:cation-translocating P-type ATPase [Shiella aurantiaca]MDN4164474.1 cation-translocating P-type ATPase [Shiella aurantiaca]